MTVTPLATTARDVLAWDRERGEPELGFGFTQDEESRALRSVSS
jgi:2'-hydroxyisoflavone reductase